MNPQTHIRSLPPVPARPHFVAEGALAPLGAARREA